MEYKYDNINQFNSFIPSIDSTSNSEILNISEVDRIPKEIFFKIFDDKIIDLIIVTSNKFMNNYLLNKYNFEETDIPKLVLDHNPSNSNK